MPIIYCPECDTTATVEQDADAEKKVQNHNESLHDGEPVATVAGEDDPLKANKMVGDAGPEGMHSSGVRAICPDCEIVALFDHELAAIEGCAEHNDSHHDGNDVSGPCKWDILTDEPGSRMAARDIGSKLDEIAVATKIRESNEELPHP